MMNEKNLNYDRKRFLLLKCCVFVMIYFVDHTSALGRYKKCAVDDDCCRHEVCAYGRVCYPAVRCRYGCPDGECRRAADDDPLGPGYETCWPFAPCSPTSPSACGPGNVCTLHHNLGYPVCQYNLDIGSSLCYRGTLSGGGGHSRATGRRTRTAFDARLLPPEAKTANRAITGFDDQSRTTNRAGAVPFFNKTRMTSLASAETYLTRSGRRFPLPPVSHWYPRWIRS